MINNTKKPIARLTKKRREKTQMANVRNERGVTIIESFEIKKIIKKYHKQLYDRKHYNREEMCQFCDRLKLPNSHKKKKII